MPLEKVPAVILATEGFKLSEFQAQYLNKYAKKFKKIKKQKKFLSKKEDGEKMIF